MVGLSIPVNDNGKEYIFYIDHVGDEEPVLTIQSDGQPWIGFDSIETRYLFEKILSFVYNYRIVYCSHCDEPHLFPENDPGCTFQIWYPERDMAEDEIRTEANKFCQVCEKQFKFEAVEKTDLCWKCGKRFPVREMGTVCTKGKTPGDILFVGWPDGMGCKDCIEEVNQERIKALYDDEPEVKKI